MTTKNFINNLIIEIKEAIDEGEKCIAHQKANHYLKAIAKSLYILVLKSTKHSAKVAKGGKK